MTSPYLAIRLRTPYTGCNLACPYCITRHVNKNLFDLHRFRNILSAIQRLPFKVNLHLGIEGEIFTSPEILEEVRVLCNSPNNLQAVSFLSNIQASWEDVIEPFLSSVDREKLGIGCTLHDLVIHDIDDFFAKAARIRSSGAATYVTHVALPGRISYIQNYKKRCEEVGAPLILNGLIGRVKGIQGVDSDKTYPQAYDETERRQLREVWDTPHSYQMLIHASSPCGMSCTAGSHYVFVEPNGEVFPCSKIKTSLGNLISGGIRVLKEPIPCPSDRCWCGNQNQALCIVDAYYERTRNIRMFFPKAGLSLSRLYEGYNPSIFPDRNP